MSPQYDLSVCYSLAPVLFLNDRTAHSAFSWVTPSHVRNGLVPMVNSTATDIANPVGGVSTPTSAAHRPRGVSGDFPHQQTSSKDLSSSVNDKYILNHAFSQALTLLQADVVTLCIRVGIPPECLWPPQAILLNLSELQLLCAKCVKRNSAVLAVERAANETTDGEVPLLLPLLNSTSPNTSEVDDITQQRAVLHSLIQRHAHIANCRGRGNQCTLLGVKDDLETSGGAAVWEGLGLAGDEQDYDMVQPDEEEEKGRDWDGTGHES